MAFAWVYLLLLTSLCLTTSDDKGAAAGVDATTPSYNTSHGGSDDSDDDDEDGGDSGGRIEDGIFVASLVIAGLGLLGNSLVIAVFLLNWGLITRTLTSLYIFHQSVIDLVSSVMFLTLTLDGGKPLLLVPGWVGTVACKLWYSRALFWSLLHVSTLNLVLVTSERYLSVLHPVFRRNHCTRRTARATMGLAWLLALAYQSYWVVVSKREGALCFQEFPSDALQNAFGGLTFLVEYLLPLSFMSFAYVRIIFRLKKLSRFGDRASRQAASPRKRALSSNSLAACERRRSSCSAKHMLVKARRNVTKTLCLVFATYVVCWTPVEIEYIVYSAGILPRQLAALPRLQRATKVLVMCNMCLNPVIYAAKYREFQVAFRQTWDRILCREVATNLFPPMPSA